VKPKGNLGKSKAAPEKMTATQAKAKQAKVKKKMAMLFKQT
jgi:hypothetical protein